MKGEEKQVPKHSWENKIILKNMVLKSVGKEFNFFFFSFNMSLFENKKANKEIMS